MKGQTVTGVRVARVCKDGSVLHHTISISPTYKGGKIDGVEGYIIDDENQ